MKVPYYFFSESGHFGTKKVVFFQVAQAPYPAKLGEIISNLPWSEVFFLRMGWVLLLAPPTPTLWHDGDMICDHFPAQSFEGVKILGEMKGVPSGGRVDLCCLSIGFEQLVILANFFWDVKLWRQGCFKKRFAAIWATDVIYAKSCPFFPRMKMTRDSTCSLASSV